MTKRSKILLLIIFSSITVFTVQSISQPRDFILTSRQSDAERSPRSRSDLEQWRKDAQKRADEMKKEFLREKYAVRATEEQWILIKAKLEKVRYLRGQAHSTVGMGLTSSSSSSTNSRGRAGRNLPTWQWDEPWKDKAPSEWTVAQKLAMELIKLVESENTTPEQSRRTMDALRMARRKEAEIIRQLSDTQKELRELLITRQEAALVLMNWL
ncbi:MAG TPA: hypothetical protein DIU00_14765 [Phycisphaerales bacterium]|nr:hypothetical protein [Phycisphaerales bacterium]